MNNTEKLKFIAKINTNPSVMDGFIFISHRFFNVLTRSR